MSESEKFEAQGRAHAALKEARANVATIRVKLAEYVRELAHVSSLISKFASDPLQENSSGIPLWRHLKTTLQSLNGSSAADLIEELVREKERVEQLEAQIREF